MVWFGSSEESIAANQFQAILIDQFDPARKRFFPDASGPFPDPYGRSEWCDEYENDGNILWLLPDLKLLGNFWEVFVFSTTMVKIPTEGKNGILSLGVITEP